MAKDILLDNDGDLLIVNGDFVIGESLDQEVAAILQSIKGDYKEFPTFGLDLIREVKANIDQVELEQILKKEFKKDGKNYQELKEYIQQRTNENH